MLKKLLTNNKHPYLNFVLSCLIMAILFYLWAISMTLFKLVGTPFMLLPHLFGITNWVSDADQISLKGGESGDYLLPEPGYYTLATPDGALLMIHALTVNSVSPKHWLEVNNELGEPVATTLLERGIRPYDPVTVPGRPVLRFLIEKPGVYTLRLTDGDENSRIYLYEDTTVGKDALLLSLQGVQLLLIIAAMVYRWRQRDLERRQVAEKIARGKAQAWEKAFGYEEGTDQAPDRQ